MGCCTCIFPEMASAPPFPTSFLFSPPTTPHLTYFLSSLQLQPKRSLFNQLNAQPLSHFSIKCSASTHGSTADANFFQENKEIHVSLSLSLCDTHISHSPLFSLTYFFSFCGVRTKRAKGFGRNGR